MQAMQFPAQFSIDLFLPLLYDIDCFSNYKVYKLPGEDRRARAHKKREGF